MQVLAAENALLEATGAMLGSTPWLAGRSDDDDTPAVLIDEICLVPGSPVVRVEEAPGNARRIFTGIDIVAYAHTGPHRTTLDARSPGLDLTHSLLSPVLSSALAYPTSGLSHRGDSGCVRTCSSPRTDSFTQ